MARVAVVTGCARARGIGMACVRQLEGDGFRVVGIDVDAARPAGWGPLRMYLACDISNHMQVVGLPQRLAELGVECVHCLVNNASIADPFLGEGDDLHSRLQAFDRYLAVNLAGAFYVTTALAPLMSAGAAVINISSTRAHQSEPNSEGYAASKAGLVGLTHAQAASLGPRVRVNAVLPGWIDTEDAVEPNAETGSEAGTGPSSPPPRAYSQGIRESDHAWHWAGRVGVPGDVAEMCAFLADGRRSGFITGQQFVIDGGVSRRMVYPE